MREDPHCTFVLIYKVKESDNVQMDYNSLFRLSKKLFGVGGCHRLIICTYCIFPVQGHKALEPFQEVNEEKVDHTLDTCSCVVKIHEKVGFLGGFCQRNLLRKRLLANLACSKVRPLSPRSPPRFTFSQMGKKTNKLICLYGQSSLKQENDE